MLPRCDYLRSGGVILKTLERWPVELRVANDLSRRIDERDAVPGRDARLIGQGIRKSSGLPLRRQQPRLTGEVVLRLVRDAGVDLVVDDDYDCHDHHRNDRE